MTCDSYCSPDFTAFTLGACADGVCNYGSIVSMSTDCLPNNDTANCTKDLYGVEPCGSGKQQLVAKCVDGTYQYIVYADNQCIPKTFLEQYGLWIAGGIFILALVVFIVTIPKKKRGKK